MHSEADISDARGIMLEFAERTGLTGCGDPARRYLWTDAHAVCNFLSLYRQTGEPRYQVLAVQLVDQVHAVLGKHRSDDARQGWLSGLDEAEGRRHPTAGGLRIGKAHNERRPNEPYDEQREWDRDGQYFHYLTKWMHALYRMSAVTHEPQYCRWAAELASVALAAFARVLVPGDSPRLVWKMSVDLSYPLVPAAGLHDPLDGYITCQELALCPQAATGSGSSPGLSAEITAMAAMIEGQNWETEDALGIGGLLFDAWRVLQLTAAGRFNRPELAARLLRDSRSGLDRFVAQTSLRQPAQYRLAFRELGLAIGLRAVASMRPVAASLRGVVASNLLQNLEALERLLPLGRVIEEFWREADNQLADSWREHRDINSVMLATSLLPDEFLGALLAA